MSAGRTGKPSGATRSSSKRHPHTRFPLLPEIGLLKERTLGKPDVRAPAVLEALAPRPRGGTVDTADLKSASGKPECRFESGRGHQCHHNIKMLVQPLVGVAQVMFSAV